MVAPCRPLQVPLLALLLGLAGCAGGASPTPPLRGTVDHRPEVRVTTAAELVAALRSHTQVVLAPGDYQLDALPRTRGPHHRWGAFFEGHEYPEFEQDMLVLEGLRDVTLRSERPGAARLVTGIASATVVVLADCEGVTLQDLSIGHSVEGTCGGGVVMVLGGARVHVDGCALSGSGTFGVEAYRTRDLRVARTHIFHTSEGALRVFDSDGVTVRDTRIADNTSVGSFVVLDRARRVALERVVFEDNHYDDTAVDDQALLAVSDSPGVTLRDAVVRRNSAEYFRVGDLEVEHLTQTDNRWTVAETP